MKAVINIKGVIGNIPSINEPAYTFTELAADVKEARENGATEFEFVIDSDGGLVEEGFLMASYIQSLPEKTTAFAVRVFSIANIVFFACDQRTSEPTSLFMLHQAWASVNGNSDELRGYAEMLDKESDRIASYIASRSNLDIDAVKGLMNTDRFIEETEADRLGFFNSIPTLAMAAFANKETLSRGIENKTDLQTDNTTMEESKDHKGLLAQIKALVSSTPKQEVAPVAMEGEEDGDMKEKMLAMKEEIASLKAQLAKYKDGDKEAEEKEEMAKALKSENAELLEGLNAVVAHLKSTKSAANALTDLPSFTTPSSPATPESESESVTLAKALIADKSKKDKFANPYLKNLSK